MLSGSGSLKDGVLEGQVFVLGKRYQVPESTLRLSAAPVVTGCQNRSGLVDAGQEWKSRPCSEPAEAEPPLGSNPRPKVAAKAIYSLVTRPKDTGGRGPGGPHLFLEVEKVIGLVNEEEFQSRSAEVVATEVQLPKLREGALEIITNSWGGKT